MICSTPYLIADFYLFSLLLFPVPYLLHLQVFSHTLSNDSEYGVMSHYWSTGEVVNWDTVIDYYVDGETTPSISLMEDMACGQCSAALR